jgi:hypothetical protein
MTRAVLAEVQKDDPEFARHLRIVERNDRYESSSAASTMQYR